MNKQEMKNVIISKLYAIGLFVQESTVSDIEINTQLLDAAWSSGSKKIEYRVLASLNDEKRILFYWELKKEINSGFSFGTSSETYSQSGATVFRKVKSVGFGIDGKAYEYNFDLGEVAKTFKETAKNNGWKFKVVLSKKKALYSR